MLIKNNQYHSHIFPAFFMPISHIFLLFFSQQGSIFFYSSFLYPLSYSFQPFFTFYSVLIELIYFYQNVSEAILEAFKAYRHNDISNAEKQKKKENISSQIHLQYQIYQVSDIILIIVYQVSDTNYIGVYIKLVISFILMVYQVNDTCLRYIFYKYKKYSKKMM